MKNTILSIAFSLCLVTYAASGYSQQWQQQVKFMIDVTLNGGEHTLDGFEKIEYINNSPDTLHFIWFHLWPNAYKNDKTAYSEYLLSQDRTDFYFSGKDQKGYINNLNFRVNGTTARTEDHPEHLDIIKVILPAPLVIAISCSQHARPWKLDAKVSTHTIAFNLLPFFINERWLNARQR